MASSTYHNHNSHHHLRNKSAVATRSISTLASSNVPDCSKVLNTLAASPNSSLNEAGGEGSNNVEDQNYGKVVADDEHESKDEDADAVSGGVVSGGEIRRPVVKSVIQSENANLIRSAEGVDIDSLTRLKLVKPSQPTHSLHTTTNTVPITVSPLAPPTFKADRYFVALPIRSSSPCPPYNSRRSGFRLLVVLLCFPFFSLFFCQQRLIPPSRKLPLFFTFVT
ncbi:hypothetical protein PIB30_021487 [Stylosanthes scabra]|uniref:Uncharacterized protein n=1 Tax=Stylosanthes scabra TaxID=79078 RepID=A0ABU6Y7K2_9FABA|nr:hypothetical protein [Stylosanthes scabra]